MSRYGTLNSTQTASEKRKVPMPNHSSFGTSTEPGSRARKKEASRLESTAANALSNRVDDDNDCSSVMVRVHTSMIEIKNAHSKERWNPTRDHRTPLLASELETTVFCDDRPIFARFDAPIYNGTVIKTVPRAAAAGVSLLISPGPVERRL